MQTCIINDSISKAEELMNKICPKNKDLAITRCKIEDEYTRLSLDWNDNILSCSVTAYVRLIFTNSKERMF